MEFVFSKYISSYTLALMLIGSIQGAEAESFMDTWLSRQVASQLQGQMPSSSSFQQDDWLARQKAKAEAGTSSSSEDWLASQAASQAASSNSFSQDAWLARQAESLDAASQDGGFSQEAWTPATSWEADEDLEKNLLSDIEESLGKEHRQLIEGRIVTVEARMGQMFQALPKNEYGKLGHSSVRYMLHRFFVEQHGWFIDGLFTEGAALNTSSPAYMLKDRVPMFVQGLFEKRLGGRGFGKHEMAVLVAVVEDSVQQEANTELKKTYKALGLPLDTDFDEEQVETFIDVFMGSFVMNTNVSSKSADYLYRQTAEMPVYYPTWLKAQAFFREVRQSQVASGKTTFSFASVAAIINKLVDSFGTFHGQQCQGLKKQLVGLEKKGSAGCVSLPDFYEKGLKEDSNWMFIESPAYMRQIGVLDESDPKHPRLLSANYINSPTNCLQPTGYYMVCCHNECDDILGKLEGQLGKPSATPTEIMASVKLTVKTSANAASLRTGLVAPALRRRLQEVADFHDGQVPIHGRLFAQWLHHVFPHECPYPHMSGSKHQQWTMDFEDETGKVSQLTGEEMKSYMLAESKAPKSNKTLRADAGSCAPWQSEEELFAPFPRGLPLHELENDPHLWNVSGGIACLAAISTFMISLLRTFKSLTKLREPTKMLQV